MHPATILSFNEELEKIAEEKRKKYEPPPGNAAAATGIGAGLGAAAGAGGAIMHGRTSGMVEASKKIENLRSVKRQGPASLIPKLEFKIGTKEQVHAFKNRHAALKRPGAKARRQKVLTKILNEGKAKGMKAGLKRAPLAALGLGAAGAAAGYGAHKLMHPKKSKD